jgi:hypothetical protein
VQAGERVMLVSENCIAQVTALFAIASLDAWSVNVNARLTGPGAGGDPRPLRRARGAVHGGGFARRGGARRARGRRTAQHGELMASLHGG